MKYFQENYAEEEFEDDEEDEGIKKKAKPDMVISSSFTFVYSQHNNDSIF